LNQLFDLSVVAQQVQQPSKTTTDTAPSSAVAAPPIQSWPNHHTQLKPLNQARLAMHITFFWAPDRCQYLEQTLRFITEYPCPTVDVFVHTNVSCPPQLSYLVQRMQRPNVRIQVVPHTLAPGEHPYWLPWKCHPLMAQHQGQYDTYVYLEDDIGIPAAALEYWRTFTPVLQAANLDLGFLRLERKAADGQLYVTDQTTRLKRSIVLRGVEYAVLENPYCAFWIYDGPQFAQFTASKAWREPVTYGPDVAFARENAAIGMKGLAQYSVIPVSVARHDGHAWVCAVYHLPNNYANAGRAAPVFGTIKLNDLLEQPRQAVVLPPTKP
jgi:hypothetical protein